MKNTEKPTDRVGFIATDQYGQDYHGLKHPRKDLLNRLGRQHASKMYRNTNDGRVRHVGYIIAGLWLEVRAVHVWKHPEK